jgi:ABC-type dipeptide/oligopeptide/nickel transport system ATPase component
MQNGRLVEADTVEKILTTPSQDYTQRLLDSMLEDGPVRPYPFDDDASPVQVKE